MKFALVFLAVAIMDWMWCRYTLAVTAHQAWSAGSYSVVLYLMGAYVTMQYVHDWHVLPFALFGAFVGTVAAVRR